MKSLFSNWFKKFEGIPSLDGRLTLLESKLAIEVNLLQDRLKATDKFYGEAYGNYLQSFGKILTRLNALEKKAAPVTVAKKKVAAKKAVRRVK